MEKIVNKEPVESRQFKMKFVPIEGIHNLQEFIKKYPIEFIPRKEDIARILTLAETMHERRVKKGEKKMTDPIKIIDVGGANGALGKLIIDLARENGLEIEYVIVDPDKPTVSQAEDFYQKDPELKFEIKKANDFVIQENEEDEDMVKMLKQRDKILQEGPDRIKKIRKFLNSFLDNIDKANVDEETLRKFYEQCRDEYGLRTFEKEFTVDFYIAEFNKFKNTNNYLGHVIGEFLFFEKAKLREDITRLTQAIEYKQKKKSSCDLVINSWMPPEMDFTRSIREVNGAAILYIMERHGATGMQAESVAEDQGFNRDNVGNEQSYKHGISYLPKLAWLSHSSCELIEGKRQIARKQATNLLDTYGVFPSFLSNVFLVQVKANYSGADQQDQDLLNPEEVGVEVGEAYPWEQELKDIGVNDLPPIILQPTDDLTTQKNKLKIVADELRKDTPDVED